MAGTYCEAARVRSRSGFCHTLRHDGIDYGDYIEQITYLLFLKMADERERELPAGCEWPSLRDQSGTALIDHYIDVLRTLGKTKGILGDIYSGAQSRFNNPVNRKRLINLIDETEWTSLNVDVKAEAYEGLLEKAASDLAPRRSPAAGLISLNAMWRGEVSRRTSVGCAGKVSAARQHAPGWQRGETSPGSGQVSAPAPQASRSAPPASQALYRSHEPVSATRHRQETASLH